MHFEEGNIFAFYYCSKALLNIKKLCKQPALFVIADRPLVSDSELVFDHFSARKKDVKVEE